MAEETAKEFVQLLQPSEEVLDKLHDKLTKGKKQWRDEFLHSGGIEVGKTRTVQSILLNTQLTTFCV